MSAPRRFYDLGRTPRGRWTLTVWSSSKARVGADAQWTFRYRWQRALAVARLWAAGVRPY